MPGAGGRYQVCGGFGLHQGHPSVGYGAPGKFAGAGGTGTGVCEGLEYVACYEWGAVYAEFHDVFARECTGSAEYGGYGLVYGEGVGCAALWHYVSEVCGVGGA